MLYNKDDQVKKVCWKGTKEEQKERRNTTRKIEKKKGTVKAALGVMIFFCICQEKMSNLVLDTDIPG